MSTDDLDAIIGAGRMSREALEGQIRAMEEAKVTQPERLAEARVRARAARDECLGDPENSWQATINAVSTVDPASGEMTGLMAIPGIDVNELWGARLAFDLLGVTGDEDEVVATLGKYFAQIKDTSHAWLVAAAALDTIANFVVPQLLNDIEQHGDNWDTRVWLAEAAESSWKTRI